MQREIGRQTNKQIDKRKAGDENGERDGDEDENVGGGRRRCRVAHEFDQPVGRVRLGRIGSQFLQISAFANIIYFGSNLTNFGGSAGVGPRYFYSGLVWPSFLWVRKNQPIATMRRR